LETIDEKILSLLNKPEKPFCIEIFFFLDDEILRGFDLCVFEEFNSILLFEIL
jgi:hypothetical protein